MENSSDAIIVGAGPVGLLTALGLAQMGQSVTILEAEAVLNSSPRAANYTEHTLGLLDRMGLLDAANLAGVRNRIVQFRWPADDLLIPVDVVKADPTRKYPYNLHFGQDRLGQIVVDRLNQMSNVRLLWNHRVTGLSHDARGAEVTVETPSGQTSFRGDWLIGTDGGRSFVRRALGVNFEGHTWPERFVATNIIYDFQKYGYAPANMRCDGANWAVVAMIDGTGLWRVTFGEDASLPEEDVFKRIPQHYDLLLPGKEERRMVAASPYRVHERTCDTYRVGRVILAGDAAHLCNPCGGRGLTGGIMDADHLLQAMGAIFGGTGDERLLDEYSQVRRREFLEVSSPLASNFKRMLEETDPERRRKDQEQIGSRGLGRSKISDIVIGAAQP